MINIKVPSGEKKKSVVYRCPGCNVKNAFYRKKTNDYKCKTCDCVWEELDETREKV